MFCIRQVGMDEEFGVIDTSRVYEKVPISKRGKVEKLLDLIEDLSKEMDEIPYGKILEETNKLGMKVWEVNDFLDKLKVEDQIYEPKSGVISLT